MFGLLSIQPGDVLLFRHIEEFLNSAEYRCQRCPLLLKARPLEPKPAMHLIAFEPDERERHVCPTVCIGSWRIGAFEVDVINIERKLSIEIVLVNLWPWTCCLAGPEVEKAKLVPHHASNMDLDRRKIVMGSISVQAHAFCQPYRGTG